MEKWQKYLQVLGLTEAESKVYLHILKSGPSPVLQVAKLLELSRVTIYNVIESLTEQGLMTSVEKGRKQLYASEPPERIIILANSKIHKMKSMVEEIKSGIDELKLIQSGDKPVVKMYEGSEAFEAIQEDLLKSDVDTMYEFGNFDDIEKMYPKRYEDEYYKKLEKKNIKRKGFYFSSDVKEGFGKKGTADVYYSNDTDFHGDLLIYDDKVWLSSFKGKQISVMIKDPAIMQMVKKFFEVTWNNLKK